MGGHFQPTRPLGLVVGARPSRASPGSPLTANRGCGQVAAEHHEAGCIEGCHTKSRAEVRTQRLRAPEAPIELFCITRFVAATKSLRRPDCAAHFAQGWWVHTGISA